MFWYQPLDLHPLTLSGVSSVVTIIIPPVTIWNHLAGYLHPRVYKCPLVRCRGKDDCSILGHTIMPQLIYVFIYRSRSACPPDGRLHSCTYSLGHSSR